jgi:hypothetical protein
LKAVGTTPSAESTCRSAEVGKPLDRQPAYREFSGRKALAVRCSGVFYEA